MFCSDYPRGLTNCLWLRRFPAFDALPVALALAVALLLARRCFPVSLLRFPPRSLFRFRPALSAAIALARLPRMKLLFAPFEQTPPQPRSALPPGRRLIFARSCKTLGRDHLLSGVQ